MLVQANVPGAQKAYEQYSYLPFKTWGGYSFDMTPPYYSYFYTVPDGLDCDGIKARCVLQWHWVTGNSCTPPGTPPEFAEKSINECGGNAPYPEEVSGVAVRMRSTACVQACAQQSRVQRWYCLNPNTHPPHPTPQNNCLSFGIAQTSAPSRGRACRPGPPPRRARHRRRPARPHHGGQPAGQAAHRSVPA